MNVKVIDSKNFSKEDVKNFLLLYEKLLRQYRPRGFSKKEEFSIANFKKAIDSLPEINQKHLYFYLDKTNTYDKFILAETFFKLRTVNYRAFYDFELIKSLTMKIMNLQWFFHLSDCMISFPALVTMKRLIKLFQSPKSIQLLMLFCLICQIF